MILIELLFIFEKIPSAVPLPLSLICCYNRKWPSIDAHTAKWMRLRKREAGTVQKEPFLSSFFFSKNCQWAHFFFFLVCRTLSIKAVSQGHWKTHKKG